MVVTNTATDPDIPTNALTYHFDKCADRATIDINGVINWTPETSQIRHQHHHDGGNRYEHVGGQCEVLEHDQQFHGGGNHSVMVNTPPWLPPQTNQVVNEQTTLVVTNTGMDSNIPRQYLVTPCCSSDRCGD